MTIIKSGCQREIDIKFLMLLYGAIIFMYSSPRGQLAMTWILFFDAIMSQGGKETGEAGVQLQSLENWRNVHG